MTRVTWGLASVLASIALSVATPTDVRAQACVPAPEGIVAWWPLDEATGPVATDVVGGNDAVYVGNPLPDAGLVGGSLHFNGVDTYAAAPDSDLWAFGTGEFTLELWANFDVPAHGSMGHPGDVFVYHGNGPGLQDKWFLALSSTDLEFGPYTVSTAEGTFAPLAPFAPVVGQWYHLAVARSGTDYAIYVDGVLAAAATNSAVLPNPNSLLTIGAALEPLGSGMGFGGVMNGRLDEVTLYHRRLGDAELAAIAAAGSAGKCKGLAISTSVLGDAQIGKPYSRQLEAVNASGPLTWSLVGGSLPAGVTLGPDGVLGGTPEEAGDFTLIIEANDGANAAQVTLTLLVGLAAPGSDLRVNKVGTLAVPGRMLDYFIVVENQGAVTLDGVTVEEHLVSRRFDGSMFSFVSASPDPVVLADGLVALWIIETMPPGERTVITYRVVLNPTTPFGTLVSGDCGAHPDGDATMASLQGRMQGIGYKCAQCTDVCKLSYCDDYSSCVKGCPKLFRKICVSGCAIAFAKCAGCMNGCLDICKEEQQQSCPVGQQLRTRNAWRAASQTSNQSCNPCPKGFACDEQDATGPVDPNEKLVAAKHFIQPDQALVYPIHFENIGEVEAVDVFIRDVLDANLDLSTVEFLTPTGASLDQPSRLVKWDLLGTNLAAGASDNVLFSVKPLPGLPSGTEIRNSAEIQFEVFDPLVTAEVVNVIDSTAPECVVDVLPAETPRVVFPVSWVSSDAVGEVEGVSVFVSTDGGPFVPLVEGTTETSTSFVGEVGKTYGFSCVAVDTAGNTEVQEPVAEATTLVNPSSCLAAAKSKLLLKNKDPNTKDKAKWLWAKGGATLATEFGDPSATSTLTVVITGANGVFKSFSLPPGAPWESKGEKGFKYIDKSGINDGAAKVVLKAGEDGKTKVVFLAKGLGVEMPDLGGLASPVSVRLESDESSVCWESVLAIPTKSTAELWKATAP